MPFPSTIPTNANRWTLALTLAARAFGRDFRGQALSGDAPAHLDPNQIARAAAANDVAPATQMAQRTTDAGGQLTPRGAWPFRRQWF